MQQFTITHPADWHVHLRDGDYLRTTVPHLAREFHRAIVMPNLKPPVVSAAQAAAYRDRILAALPVGLAFEPLMTLYLTDNTPPAEIRRARDSGCVHAVKLYPAGATTHSDAGVSALDRCYPTLAAMEEAGLPLLIHGEVTAAHVDIFDRERVFIDEVLLPLVQRFPGLKIVFKHITTREAVAFVLAAPTNNTTTNTTHQKQHNHNNQQKNNKRPHHY